MAARNTIRLNDHPASDMEDSLQRLNLESAFEDAACIGTEMVWQKGAFYLAPKPGPQLPQKKKPKIL